MPFNFNLNARDIKRNQLAIFLALFMTSGMLFGCIKNGMDKDDIMLRFREKQAVTMMSGLYLGVTAMTALSIYLIKRRSGEARIKALFWLLSAAGFFYLCMDEYFMIHEGMDEAVWQFLFHKDISIFETGNTLRMDIGFCFCNFWTRTNSNNTNNLFVIRYWKKKASFYWRQRYYKRNNINFIKRSQI